MVFFQHLHELGPFSGNGTEKDDNIPVFYGPEGAVFFHHHAAVHDFMDAAGDEASFQRYIFHVPHIFGHLRIFEALPVDEVHGNAAAHIGQGPFFFVAAGIEGFRISVVQLQGFGCHDLAENEIDGRKNGGVASEIAVQVDSMTRGVFIQGIGVVFLKENGGIRLAEAVNALLDIAHHEAAAAVRYQGGNEFLHAVGVLVFINHHFLEPAADGQGGSGREKGRLFRREMRIVPVQKDVQGVMLHVIEIHEAFLLLPGPEGGGKIQGQTGKDGDCGKHGCRFGNPLLFRYLGKGGNFLLPQLFSAVPKGLDGFRFRRFGEIGGFGKMVGFRLGLAHTFQPVKGKRGQGKPVLPAFHGRKGRKIGIFIAHLLAVYRFCGGAHFHNGKYLAIGVHDFFGKGHELFQYRPVPGKVIHGGLFRNAVVGGKAADPVLRKGKGGGEMEDAEHHIL